MTETLFGCVPDESVAEHIRNCQMLCSALDRAIVQGQPAGELLDAVQRRLARARFQLTGSTVRVFVIATRDVVPTG